MLNLNYSYYHHCSFPTHTATISQLHYCNSLLRIFLFPVLTFLYPSFNWTAGAIILQWRYILSLTCSELWSGISFYWKTSKQQSQNMEDFYVVYTCWCRTISINQSIMLWSSNQIHVYEQGRIDYFQQLIIWLYGARKSPSFIKPSSCWWKLEIQARWSLCLILWLWSLLNNKYIFKGNKCMLLEIIYI